VLHGFAAWLIKRGILKANPLANIDRPKRKEPHKLQYSEELCRAIIARYPTVEMQAAAAAMCSTSMEWAAIDRCYRTEEDINEATRIVQAHGTKTPTRERPVVFTHD
jgi:site-specific recombinase XerC